MHKYSRGIPSSPFVPLNGFRIDLSFCTSESKRNREIGSGKPLERPQTGGCGIGRGVDKGESFSLLNVHVQNHTLYTKAFLLHLQNCWLLAFLAAARGGCICLLMAATEAAGDRV